MHTFQRPFSFSQEKNRYLWKRIASSNERTTQVNGFKWRGGIPCHTIIQSLLRIVTPNRKHITRHDVYNFCVKSMVMLRKMREKGESLESIKFEKDTLSHLIKAGGIDDFTTDYVDDPTTAVKDIYMEILSNEESRIKIFALLEKLG